MLLLRETIKKIRIEKSWTQAQMAKVFDVAQQDIQGMENAGRNLEKQWMIFLKMLPYCIELDLIGERDLLIARKHGSTTTASDTKAGKAKTHLR
jgi:DNA-binding XRE family transcriptional regulator